MTTLKIAGTRPRGPTRITLPLDLVASMIGRGPAAARPVGDPLERLSLLDKLGARLDFERTGAQLYQALIPKLEAHGAFRGGPTRAEVERLRNGKLGHAVLVQHLIVKLGGDPAVTTLAAHRQAALSAGLCHVIGDPRTTLVDCLDTVVVAELVDRESWALLGKLMAPLGDAQAQAQIREVERAEAEHLAIVRAWLAIAVALGASRAIS